MYGAAQDDRMWSMQYGLSGLQSYELIPKPDPDEIRQLDEEAATLKIETFAVNIVVNITPASSGQWDTIPGRGIVWRLGICSENAFSLSLRIDHFKMQKGMRLFVYNSRQTEMSGPFDNRNNGNFGVLPVRSLAGDTIILEWDIPTHLPPKEFFTITHVGYGYRQPELFSLLKAAASCNIDINCVEGNHWQREKRSVVKLEITKDNNRGISYCTGVLVNQASDSIRPYLLTANHCISSITEAINTVFIFGYERITCNGPIASVETIGGSTLLATKKELDFSLVELSQAATLLHNPYYAGWNTSTSAPASAVGIHHPQGDVKKISIEDDPLVNGTYVSSELNCDPNAHWRVLRWDKGTTERGSSGSPIFDPNHYVVGTLTGGDANCTNPVNDYYAKFALQWDKYNTDSSLYLKCWLNPDDKPITSLDGYDPFAGFNGECDTIGHIGNNEQITLLPSMQWGYISGHNDKYWTGFAEKFENDTIVSIIGLVVDVAKVYSHNSIVDFTIWTGTDYPVTPVYRKQVIVTPEYENYAMHIYFDKAVQIRGNYFVGFTIDYNPVDTFAIYQSAERQYPGLSNMYIEDGGSWRSLLKDVPPLYSSLAIKVMGQFGRQQVQKDVAPEKQLKMLFEPFGNIVYIYANDFNESVIVDCFDASGKKMPVHEIGRSMAMLGENTYLQIEIDVNNLAYGMYIIRVRDSKHVQSGKFVKL